MKSTPYVLAAALGLLTTPLDAQRPRRDREPPPPLEHGTWKDGKCASEALGRDMSYGVYLPASYAEDTERRYPLVVWLHGMWEDENRFHTRGGAAALDKLIGDGALPELILVSPSAGRSSFYINGKASKEEDALLNDFLHHVDSEYRVATDRAQRVLMGVSLGGMAALKVAMRHPQLFGTVATHSAAIFPADLDNLDERFQRAMRSQWLGPVIDEVFGDPIDRELWKDNNPLALAASVAADDLRELHIYFDAGTRDRYGFQAGNELLHAALDKAEVPHTWRLIEGGGHSWGDGLAEQALPDSLRFVADQLRAAAGRSALRGLLDGNGGKGDGKEAKPPGKGR